MRLFHFTIYHFILLHVDFNLGLGHDVSIKDRGQLFFGNGYLCRTYRIWDTYLDGASLGHGIRFGL